MKNILFRLPLAPFLPKTKPAASPPKILLVRDDIIGDLVVPTSAVIKWLKDRQHDVFLVLRREFTPIGRLMLPEDRLIPLDMTAYRSSLRYRWHFIKHVRSLGFALTIGSTIHSSVNDDIVRSSGAPARYGYKRRDTLKELWKLRCINKIDSLPVMRGQIYTHMLEHERHFLSHIFSTPVEALSPHVRAEKTKLAGMPDRYIHYVADAGNMRRVFPADRLLPILARLANTHSLPLVLTALKPIAYTHKNCLNLSGRLRLEELIPIIANAFTVVGNESGPVHLASIMGRPTAMFYGGGHYGKFLPANALLIGKATSCRCCDWKCPYPGDIFDCVNVDDAAVEDALDGLLRQAKAF